MEIHAEHYPDKSIIFIDNSNLIGVENKTFHILVLDSIEKGSKSISIDLSKVKYIASLGIESLVMLTQLVLIGMLSLILKVLVKV